LCPDVLDATIQQYSDINTVMPAMRNDAKPYGLKSYAFTDNPTWYQLKQAIYQNRAVIVLVKCGDGWWTARDGRPSWAAADVLPLRLGTFDDNHFVALWGYDQNHIYFRNSWSAEWGRAGDGYFDQSYMPNVLELGTAIDGPSLKQRLVSLYTSVRSLLPSGQQRRG
jgi:hypothetical protein